MQGLAIMVRLVRQAGWREGALLALVMLLARASEGVGLVIIVPLLETLIGGGAPSVFSRAVFGGLAAVGVAPALAPLLVLVVLLVSARAILVALERVLSARYQQRIVDALKRRLFASLVRAEWRWQSSKRASDHASVMIDGTGRIGQSVNQFLQFTAHMLSLGAYGIAALLLSWQVTLSAIAGGLVIHMLSLGLRRRAVANGYGLNAAHRRVHAGLDEALAGARLAKITRNEARLEARFAGAVEMLREGQIGHVRGMALAQMAMQIGGALLLAALLLGGTYWFALPVAVLLTVTVVLGRLIPVFGAVQQSYHGWLHGTPAVAEVDALIAEAEAAAEPAADAGLPPMPLGDAIRLDTVSVRFAGREENALSDVTLTLPALTTTLITGPSGAGKSSLADLLIGLIEADAGTVSVDGAVLTGSTRQRWRRSVAYVEQDVFLLHDSIRANLAWAAPDADDAAMAAALKRAAADFVFALPDGLDTIVGDRGSRLSGGERQRLALARALLGEPALLILDEATSALDPANRALVQQSLRGLQGRLTLIVIAHHAEGWDGIDQRVEIEAGVARGYRVERAAA